MDDWEFEHLNRWLEHRVLLPVGPLFCIIDGPTRGRAWPATAVRGELRKLAAQAGVRRRFAPHQLRHAHAVELAQGGGASQHHPATARAYRPRDHQHLLAGDRSDEIVNAVHSRRPPMMPASAALDR